VAWAAANNRLHRAMGRESLDVFDSLQKGAQAMNCFTRNFEDVILQRAFSDVSHGCYIDVGASHPVSDSNTFALYQGGWRGICVEPMDLRAEWHQARPHDIFINAALGESPGQLTLHEYKESGGQLSTGSAETAELWRRSGVVPNARRTVQVRTLDGVLDEHLGSRTIHFISIDVEGMEKEVLLGLNLTRYRPWVMVVEATVPGTDVAVYKPWESLILDAGYLMVYFDGVNRFYLSNEQRNLLGRFSLPPNVWDRIVFLKDMESQSRIEYLERRIQDLTIELNAYRQPTV
jgi:FkbM family methyltransferase